MNEYLVKKINSGLRGQIYATRLRDEKICLERVGRHEEVRFWYNQMACLIGGSAMRLLKASYPTPLRSGGVLPGTWTNRFSDGKEALNDEQLLEAACQAPSEFSDMVGYLAWHDDWPYAISNVSGMQNMCKSMSEVGNIVYGFDYKATVQVGGSTETSAVKRVKEALKELKKSGRTVYQEDRLLAFLETLLNSRFLHFYHEVSID